MYFKSLKDRACRDVDFYSSVYHLGVDVTEDYFPEDSADNLLNLLPGVLYDRKSDDDIERALRWYIAKRGGFVVAHGRRATSWCRWAADARECALVRLQAGLITAFSVDDELCNLTMHQLQRLNLSFFGLPPIDECSVKDKIEKEILCTEELVNQTMSEADTAHDDGPVRVELELEIPAEYRDGGLSDGDPLTVDVVSLPQKYNLSGPYLSKNYRGPVMKLSRKLVYRHAEIAALSDRKSRREDEI